MTGVRAETRPCAACAACGREILPGQLYVVEGPVHVACKPPARLNVAKVERAARTR